MKNTIHHKCEVCSVTIDSSTCTWFALINDDINEELHCENCLLRKLQEERIPLEIDITFNASRWGLLIMQTTRIRPQSESEKIQNLYIVDDSIVTPFLSITSSTNPDIQALSKSRVFGNESSLNIGLIPYESISGVISLQVQAIEQLQKIETLQFTVNNNSFISNKENILVKYPDILNECSSCGRRENGAIYFKTLLNKNGICEHCFENTFNITVTDMNFQTLEQTSRHKLQHNNMYEESFKLYYSIEYTISDSHVSSILSSDLYDKQVIPWIEATIIKEDGSTVSSTDLMNPVRREFKICKGRPKNNHIKSKQLPVCVPSNFIIAKAELKTPTVQTNSLTYDIKCPNVIKTSQLELRL